MSRHFAQRRAAREDATNLALFLGGIGLSVCLFALVILTAPRKEATRTPSEPNAATQETSITVDVYPSITLEVVPN